MNLFSTKNLGTNRALLSIINSLDSVEDNKLTISKKDITSNWTESKSSKRDICLEASKLDEVFIRSFNSELMLDTELTPICHSVSVSNYEITYQFSDQSLILLNGIRREIFGSFTIESMREMKSKYSLNLLIASLPLAQHEKEENNYLSYEFIKALTETKGCYEHQRAFYRNVVQVGFSDLQAMKQNPITYSVAEKINPETKRKISHGINVFFYHMHA